MILYFQTKKNRIKKNFMELYKIIEDFWSYIISDNSIFNVKFTNFLMLNLHFFHHRNFPYKKMMKFAIFLFSHAQ